MVVKVTLALIVPGILSVFGIAYLCAWLVDRNRSYLLLLAVSSAAAALGTCSQILGLPPGDGPNALVSGFLYTTACLTAAQGMMLRSDRAVPVVVLVAVLVVACFLIWYFYYVDRSLIIRVYIMNFGGGLIMLIAALRLTHLLNGRLTDKVLFWTLLAFALHFFPRTVLTIGFTAPQGGRVAFANSLFWQVLELSLAVFASGLVLAVLAATAADVIEDLRSERDIDHLTGVLNRRGFEAAVSSTLRRQSTAASLILGDIDHFKSINDRYGHAVGDAVLRDTAAVLQRTARKGDVIGRFGGEEFAVFLHDATLRETFECAERLRMAIAQTAFPALAGRQLTASFGIATTRGDGGWSELYADADNGLYRSKRSGRNRTMAGEVFDSTWSANGVAAGDNTDAVIDGEKTLMERRTDQ